MLQSIRDKAHGWLAWVIVILIAIPFALWGVHEYTATKQTVAVAEVNGVEIQGRDFDNEVQMRQRQLRAMIKQPGMDLSFMDAQIRQDTLDQMIEREVLLQTAYNQGFRVSDALLLAHLHNLPYFQDQGKFSQQAYEQVLHAQGFQPALFEMRMRRELLIEQVEQGISRSAFVTLYDQQQRAKLEDQQRLLTYLLIPAQRFENAVTVTDAEIEEHYKTHQQNYMTPEKVSVQYVEFSNAEVPVKEELTDEVLKQRYEERKATYTTPPQWHARHILIKTENNATPEQIAAAEQKSKDLLEKIHAGQSVEELAKQFSDDPGSKDKGGDLGWFGEGAMVKPFEDAVVALKDGEISSAPVKSQFGFHIIQRIESKPAAVREFEAVKTELKAAVQKEQAETEFYTQQEQFANLAFENPSSLDVLANTMNLKVKESPLFDRVGIAKDPIFSNPAVLKAAFSDNILKDNYNSEVIELENMHIMVLRLKEHELPQVKPLEEVKAAISATLKTEKMQAEAQKLADSLLNQLKQNVDPNSLAQDNQLNWADSQWLKKSVSTFPYPQMVQQAFKLGMPEKDHALYQTLKLGNGDYALFALLDVKEGVVAEENKENPDNKEAPKSETVRKALGDSDFQQFVAGLKSDIKIKVHADKLK
ncbi:MAG: SurA N-terminal domain-containing protein [Thiotrichaceae bacterium]